MKITAIVPKRKRLSAIYIDGEYALKLDTEAVLASRFTVGSEISDEELKTLIESSNEKRAKEKALWLISYRDHSKRELEEKIRKSSDSESAKLAVERMEELGLVNDERFARQCAEQLVNSKHLSERAARFKLAQKGIERGIIDEIMEQLAPDPREHIAALIEKKYLSALNDERGRKRAVAALSRAGYSWSDISAVLNEYTEDFSDEI